MLAPRLPAISRRVHLSLKTEKAVSGVLVAHKRGFLTLKDAQVHEPGADPVRLDGDVIVHLSNVDFAQVVNLKEV
jgi:hypothetical protein